MSDKEADHKHGVKDSFVSPRRAKKLKVLTEFLSKQESRNTFKLVSKALKKSELERTEEEGALLKKHDDVVRRIHKNREKKLKLEQRIQETEDGEDVLQAKCAQLAAAIKRSRNAVIYTGAGISTAASIPDYRGPQGVWTLLQRGEQLQPQDLSDAEPTVTHMCIAQLHRLGKVKHVVSQNCDGLHLRSGLARRCLSEVHGNMYLEYCYKCRPHREYVRLFDVTENTGVRKHQTGRCCLKCGGPLRDTIVHFGEKGGIKAPYRWKEAARAANRCDLILCLGSSLKILRRYPCLWCMDRIKNKRPKLFVVNLQWTPKDELAILKINGRCDDVITRVMKILGYEIPVYSRENDQIFELAVPTTSAEMEATSKKVLKIPASVNGLHPNMCGNPTSHLSTANKYNTVFQGDNSSSIAVDAATKKATVKRKPGKVISPKRSVLAHEIMTLTKEEVNFLKSQQICNAAIQAMQGKQIEHKPLLDGKQNKAQPCVKEESEGDTRVEPSNSFKTHDGIDRQTVHTLNGYKSMKIEDLSVAAHHTSTSSRGGVTVDIPTPESLYQQQQLLKLNVLQAQLHTLKQCREYLVEHQEPHTELTVNGQQSTTSQVTHSSPTQKLVHDHFNGQQNTQISTALAEKATVGSHQHSSLANIEMDEIILNEIANSQSDVQKQRFTEWAQSRVQNINRSRIVPESSSATDSRLLQNVSGSVTLKQPSTVNTDQYRHTRQLLNEGSLHIDTLSMPTSANSEVTSCSKDRAVMVVPEDINCGITGSVGDIVTCPSCKFLHDYGITKRRCISCLELASSHRTLQSYWLNSAAPPVVISAASQGIGAGKQKPALVGGPSSSHTNGLVINVASLLNTYLPKTLVSAVNIPLNSTLTMHDSCVEAATIQQGYPTTCAAHTPTTTDLRHRAGMRNGTTATQTSSVRPARCADINSVLNDHFYLKPQEMQKLSPEGRPSYSQSQAASTMSPPSQQLYAPHSTSVAGPQNLPKHVTLSTNSHQTRSLPSISSFMTNSLTSTCTSVITNTHSSQEHNLLKLSLKRETVPEPTPAHKHGKPVSPKKKHSPDKWFISPKAPDPRDLGHKVSTFKTELDFDTSKPLYHRSVSISELELVEGEATVPELVHRSHSQGDIEVLSTTLVLDSVNESSTSNGAEHEQGSQPEKKRKLVKQLSVPGWFGKGLTMRKRRKYKY